MTFDPSETYDTNRICLTVTGEFQGHAINAYCSPDSDGSTYFSDGEKSGRKISEKYGAPFMVDIVLLDDVYLQSGEMVDIRDEVGDALAAQFNGKVDSVFEKISNADDPIDAINSLL